ncbi:acyltransferase Pun1-like [Cornus florida]|uniref:acyltransferase Pun1-like n=1 Tax=Cornus florida TaxID=4283 RepID=UPI00289BE6FE|nr:acyltransferase Pun1-like [Cornus florida]
MATMQQPEIIKKETIKPSSPTPTHLKTHNLSLLDQLSPHIYLPMLLFYPNEAYDSPCNINEKSCKLKTSLSQTLTRYYPFAGRLANGASIECNDEGVDFYEAQIECKLSDILKKPEPETLDLFYPQGILYNESYKASLVVLQLTFFACGGMAISTCFLHKIADGATVSSFISDWAALTRQSGEKAFPEFISAIISPPNDPPLLPDTKLELGNCVTRRYVFSASKIAELKATVVNSGVPKPTRVEVVSNLIFKRAMAARRATSGSSRLSILLQPVNLRPRLSPPLPENSAGNFSWFFSIMAKDENEKDLGALVDAMKKGMAQFIDKYAKTITPNQCYSLICDVLKDVSKVLNRSESMDVFKCSSLCRYPFGQMNFGWGEPIWVGFSKSKAKNTFHLADAKEGGVEAWITLEEQDMAAFECDEELLAFASLNPSALSTY